MADTIVNTQFHLSPTSSHIQKAIQNRIHIDFFCILLRVIRCIDTMSLILDRYDSFWQTIIGFTFKLIKLTGNIINGVEASFNSYQTVDIMTGNDDSLFCKIFSSCNVIAIQSGSFIDVLMECHSIWNYYAF